MPPAEIVREIIDALDEGCHVIDHAGHYAHVNATGARHFGRTIAELVGQPFAAVHPDLLDTPAYADLLRTRDDLVRRRTNLELDIAGQRRAFELQLIPVSIGICVLSVEITERQRAEETLADKEATFRMLVDAAPDALLLVDPDGTVALANPAAHQLFGYASLAGVAIDDLVPDDLRGRHAAHRDTYHETARARRMGGRGLKLEARRADGTRVPVDISLGPARHQGRPATLAIVRDITELRALEEEFRQAQKMEAVGLLAGGVAHDFNNILSVIISYSELLAEDLPHGTPLRADALEILAAGKRAADLTSQLLAFGRRQMLSPRAVDLSQVVADLEKMLRRLLGEDVELSVVRGAGLAQVLVDRHQIEQVLLNLAVNARDAMPRGGRLVVETANARLDAQPHVMISVADNGTGMDRETLARIFEPFFTTKEVGRGTGLGLSTVHGIVRQSGGRIDVSSEPGRGTTFTIYFPATPLPPERVSTVPLPVLRGGGETILLVEDDAAVRALARSILQRAGYQVLESHHSGDAILIAEQHPAPIHLLVTDMVMPRMSGWDLAQRLRTMRPDLRVLFISGYTERAVGDAGLLDGAAAFLAKPFSSDTLLRKVREIIER